MRYFTLLFFLEGVREVEKSTRHIDSLVCEQETMGRMIELQKSFLGDTQLIQPGRKLVKEGIVNKVFYHFALKKV